MSKDTAASPQAAGDLSGHTPMMQQYPGVTFYPPRMQGSIPPTEYSVPSWPPLK
jgi:hypothetical protein